MKSAIERLRELFSNADVKRACAPYERTSIIENGRIGDKILNSILLSE